jgi:hypothetical protein
MAVKGRGEGELPGYLLSSLAELRGVLAKNEILLANGSLLRQ